MGTPAPGESTPMPGGRTPVPGSETPMHESGETGTGSPRPMNRFLEVDDATRSNSRVGTPRTGAKDPGGDVEMSEEGELDSQVKDTAGMEAKDGQVATPAPPIGAEGERMDES